MQSVVQTDPSKAPPIRIDLPARYEETLAKFLAAGSTTESREFLNLARLDSARFESEFAASPSFVITPEIEDRWNAWANSRQGQDISVRLTQACLDLLEQNRRVGLPGHDRRHFAIKVPAAALQICLEETFEGYKPLFLVSALLHDTGRLLETSLSKLPDADYQEKDHTKLSFYFAQRIFGLFPEVPSDLRDHLLFAILRHSAHVDNPSIILQALQRADREQLVGPEAIGRMLAYDMGYRGMQFALDQGKTPNYGLELPHSDRSRPWHQHVEFFMRNLYSNMGQRGDDRAEDLKIETGRFLYLALEPQVRDAVFAPEIGIQNCDPLPDLPYRSPISGFAWARISVDHFTDRFPEFETVRSMSLPKLLNQVLFAPGSMKLSVKYGSKAPAQLIRENVANLEPHQQAFLARGLAYVICCRAEKDAADLQTISRIFERCTELDPELHVARFIKRQLQLIELGD